MKKITIITLSSWVALFSGLVNAKAEDCPSGQTLPHVRTLRSYAIDHLSGVPPERSIVGLLGYASRGVL